MRAQVREEPRAGLAFWRRWLMSALAMLFIAMRHLQHKTRGPFPLIVKPDVFLSTAGRLVWFKLSRIMSIDLFWLIGQLLLKKNRRSGQTSG